MTGTAYQEDLQQDESKMTIIDRWALKQEQKAQKEMFAEQDDWDYANNDDIALSWVNSYVPSFFDADDQFV